MGSLFPLRVDYIFDVACPWCYLGAVNLDRAIQLTKNVTLEIYYRPSFFDPRIPKRGMPRDKFLAMTRGSVENCRRRHGQVAEAAKAAGMLYRPELITVQPNTLDCHRVIYWAKKSAMSDQSGAIALHLMELFFGKSADLSNINVLVQAAADFGLDAEDIRAKLMSRDDVEMVMLDARAATSQGSVGLPTYILADRYETSGVQSVEQLTAEISQGFAKEFGWPAA